MMFKIGDQVCGFWNYQKEKWVSFNPNSSFDIFTGKITQCFRQQKVMVLWDEKGVDNRESVDANLLMLHDDWLRKEAALEDEFAQLTKQVQTKMDKAADFIHQAGNIATQAGANLRS